jgi:hypothetical protein
VAVSDAQQQWIKRYPIDDTQFRITGPAFFQGGFPIGCKDYSRIHIQKNSTSDQIITEHIRNVGLDPERGVIS